MKFQPTHGLTESVEYVTWTSMKTRCYNQNSEKYPDYGGRGIRVCDRWKNSFENFYEDMGRRPSNAHSLDRFPDVNGDYGPTNCRWATLREQASNKRNVDKITFKGLTMTLPEWSKYLGLSYMTLYLRIKRRKIPVETAFLMPAKEIEDEIMAKKK